MLNLGASLLLPSCNSTVAFLASYLSTPIMHLPRRQARAEGVTLLVGENKTGYLGVRHEPKSKRNPYRAQVRRSGKDVHLGNFVTAEEAALCVARSPEGQAAAKKAAAAPPPLTSEEARQQAQAEGLTLVVVKNKTGYFGVRLNPRWQVQAL